MIHGYLLEDNSAEARILLYQDETELVGSIDSAYSIQSKILIFKDQKQSGSFWMLQLEQAGFQVETVGIGDDATTQIETIKPDLIILDLMDLERNGIGICRMLRQQPHLTMIPILILAGHPVETRQIAGLEAGADDVVAKPISFRLLLSRIRALQRRRERYFPPSMT